MCTYFINKFVYSWRQVGVGDSKLLELELLFGLINHASIVLFDYFDSASLQDPEFYEYLKEHDKELLDFNDEDMDVRLKVFFICIFSVN